MNRLRLLIVDDEPLIRSGIRTAASQVESVEVVGECGSGTEAIEAIRSKRPDLVLLDVQMPGCSGLDVVREIGAQSMPPVVFITAYDDYAVQAFELNAVDYLLKPFDDERFRESIERARTRMGAQVEDGLARRLEAVLHGETPKWPSRLVIKNGEHYEFVATETIDWIESANNYVELHCGGKQYLMGETLSGLEARLNPARFARVHRCRIVNTSRIASVHPLLSGTYAIALRDGTRLTTGRRYKEIVQELIRG